jgi:glutaminyl-tRNA synthetase
VGARTTKLTFVWPLYREDVDWLGWKPVRTTYTSDYFSELHELAVKLIRLDKAYVFHQSKADIEASREIARAKSADPNAPGDPNSPWRNRYEQCAHTE